MPTINLCVGGMDGSEMAIYAAIMGAGSPLTALHSATIGHPALLFGPPRRLHRHLLRTT